MQRVDQLLETRTAVNSAIRDSKLGYKTMGKTREKVNPREQNYQRCIPKVSGTAFGT